MGVGVGRRVRVMQDAHRTKSQVIQNEQKAVDGRKEEDR